MKILIIGNLGGSNVGESFRRAADFLKVDCHFIERRLAYEGGLRQRAVHRLFGNWPLRASKFSKDVLGVCEQSKPDLILTTGIAPLNQRLLAEIKKKSICIVNFLTDDPWSPNHICRWFMEALPEYDQIFNPRKANLNDLLRLGCRNVSYMPFGYDPSLCFGETLVEQEEKVYESDLIFVGGADRDRIPYIKALADAGLKVALYGSYWERFEETRSLTRGQSSPAVIRKATSGSKIALCLVRRANRDGHVMRSFEIPAIGACMLTEDTQEHREIFGEEGAAVLYFKTTEEAVSKAKHLLSNESERKRLSHAAHDLVLKGKNTYQDRLIEILKQTEVSHDS